jgi:hypothetical protein
MTVLSAVQLEQLEGDARKMLRLIGPRVTAADDENVAIKRCTKCSPEPEVHRCFICQFAAQERWQYLLHLKINPETCQRYANKWARNWASKV